MDKLTSYLDERNIEYEIIYHTIQNHTAEEGAEYLGIEIGQANHIVGYIGLGSI